MGLSTAMVATTALVLIGGLVLHNKLTYMSAIHPTKTMKAVAYTSRGASSVLEYSLDMPQPKLHAGQVLIQVKASSLNPCDFKMQRNPVPSLLVPLPKIPGEDIAGVVVEVGDGENSKFKVGDRVAAMMPILGSRFGAHAEYAVVDESLVATIGIDTTFEEAASLPLVSLTTIQAFSKLKPNANHEKVLIHAGAGGVGTFAIQYAKNVLGMKVVATTASREKQKFLQDLGADIVIDYRTEQFEDVVKEYDVVLDTMSWSYEGRTLGSGKNVLKPNGGHYLNILSSDWSFSEGGFEKANGPIFVKNLLVHKLWNLLFGRGMPLYDVATVKPNGEQLQDVFDFVNNGTLRPVIDRTFSLADAAAAKEYLERGHATGKVVLRH